MKNKKTKTVLLVDSENVGNKLPDKIGKDTIVYFFLSNPNVLNNLSAVSKSKRFKIVALTEIYENNSVKNEMDLVILAYLAKLMQKAAVKKKARSFIILSGDKGYDLPISILNKTFKGSIAQRAEGSLRHYVEETPDPYKEIPKTAGVFPKDKNLRKKAKKARTFESFKKQLTPSEKKSIRIEYSRCENGNPIWFEYDFYDNQYILIYSGTESGRYQSLEAGKKDYEQKKQSAATNPKRSNYRKKRRYYKPKRKKEQGQTDSALMN